MLHISAALMALSAMYVDAKYHLTSDLKNLIRTKKAFDGLLALCADLNAKDGYVSAYNGYLRTVQQYPNSTAVISPEGREWTYAQADEDVVAILMSNSAEVYFVKFAMMRTGIVGAMINHNLTGASLIHCLKVSGARVLLCTESHVQPFHDLGKQVVADELNNITPYVIDAHAGPLSPAQIDAHSEKLGMQYVPLQNLKWELTYPHDSWVKPKISERDPCMLIYTSGTTGLPKAAVLPHLIYLGAQWMAPGRNVFFPTDRMYCTMPLFHGTGSVLSMSTIAGSGGCLIIAKSFSARTFISECRRLNATCFVYVGEIIRYLMATPPSPDDKNHNLRLASGNGLRPDIWEKFRERFNVPTIYEFYAATEGQTAAFNLNVSSEGAGKVGRYGVINRLIDPTVAIVKHDHSTGEAYRDPKTGFCIRVKANEPGEIIGQILPETVQRPYYKNKSASEKKLMRDVFKKGDVWFRMGDLMMFDTDGWLMFCDRVGDTFRWKGENVATDEVTLHIASHSAVQDVAVYGIPVQNYDGQVGMAAVVLSPKGKEQFDQFCKELYPFLRKRGVPEYAIPRFIRLMDHITSTHTHKHQKAKLRTDGIHVDKINGDKLLILDVDKKVYQTLEEKHRQLMVEGKARL
ncbi:hypothetical protein DFQ27_005472 [Actinomortierella ambigua]|uniref:AMP-dependent synthetase/ligase domain-containing protein n=1 Tax=Actinomortierella ambigua TaxID=1343610 RepID=A0A9P6QIJ1_9FUNG|nr:hypothetical protein DFQ27_005472 [Actinomortierella ambigua]